MSARRIAAATATLAAAALVSPLLFAGPATAEADDPGRAGRGDALASKLVRESTAKDAFRHLKTFQAIADYNGGTRVASSRGHEQSAAYVEGVLRAAGYRLSRQEFDFVYTDDIAESLTVLSPTPRDITLQLMAYTAKGPEGGVTADVAVVPVDADATHGCEPTDFAAGAFTGRIALIKRGGCSFAVKQANAHAAGALGAVVYNNTTGKINGTIGDAALAKIPTGGISQEDGETLAAEATAGPVTVTLDIHELRENRRTFNVVAETRGGDAADTVFLGSHLDSLHDSPGINDNGSGSAGLLQVAVRLAKSQDKVGNKVKFAWWSAEEFGVLGSQAYLASLPEEQRKQIRLYLNFDTIASPNAAYFVHDGDDSDGVGAGPGPEGSAQLEKGITDFLGSKRIPYEGTDFTGLSDYAPFIAAGIPSGGTFAGADGIKTESQAARFGGLAGVAYDVNHHTAGDDLTNIDMRALDVNIDVIADAVGHYAHDLGPLTRPANTARTEGARTDAARDGADGDEPVTG
ncbi:M28 family peptidase [Streptomyces antarcticus]|uniref:M28 family peptidase n=2 Tax=Streptomyces antarcticus TaxID=2996458 RepID=UPI00226E84CD|nr:M28 family peptidase [Streptomyces sp. H34-AA3]MCY0941810.1 M28 family peptidase [Streptomyces sp. H34-AA3]